MEVEWHILWWMMVSCRLCLDDGFVHHIKSHILRQAAAILSSTSATHLPCPGCRDKDCVGDVYSLYEQLLIHFYLDYVLGICKLGSILVVGK